MAYSRGTHLEATNRFIHERLSSDPRVQVGLVPLDAERQHYLRPFHQHGLWYIQCTTTDRVHRDPDLIVPMPDEVDELLRSYNNLVSSAWKIDRRDIFNVFCGIRPLAATDGGEVAITDISRMFRINQRVGGGGVVLDLVNVKLTEFRWAGRVVGDLIAKQLRTQLARKVGRSRTHRVSLLPVVGEERFAPNRTGDRRCDREFISQKVAHYVTYQMASSLPDYLLNSGGIRDAVVFDRTGRCDLDLDLLDLMLAEMATCLHWDDQRRRGEWAAFTAIYTRMMAPAELGQRVRNHDPTASQRVPYAGVGGFD
jgi:glycerol-3-phosphate dehydrogenase